MFEDKAHLLEMLTPLYMIIILADYIYCRKNLLDDYNIFDTVSSILYAVLFSIVGIIYTDFSYFLGMSVYNFRMFNIPNTILVLFCCLLLDDLCYYIFHRFSHNNRWYWAAHSVHHSSMTFNFSAALRLSPLHILAPTILFRVPLILIGFHPGMIIFCMGLGLLYQFFIHTRRITKLHPLFELIFNTPSHHRVHHGSNEEYLDKNYGSVLIIWDRIFGTFCDESNDIIIKYGVKGQVARMEFFEGFISTFAEIFKGIHVAAWRDKINYIVGSPEWAPTKREATDVTTDGNIRL